MKTELQAAFLHGQIIAICRAMQNEEIGVIAGSRRLTGLYHALNEKGLNDELNKEFGIFRVIDSETDHLPVDAERRNWLSASLVEKEKEISECESFYKNDAMAACDLLIKKY